MSNFPMARVLGGFLYIVGVFAALIAIWNIHFGDALIWGQVVIGLLGLGVAFMFTTTLQENPTLQLAATGGLILVAFAMFVPAFWLAFTGGMPTALQIFVAAMGAVLLFICWRMIPR